MSIDCACQAAHPPNPEDFAYYRSFMREVYERLVEAREKCWVLRELFIPDTVLEQYRRWCLAPENEAWHRPVVFLALTDDHLARLAGLVHRFIGRPANLVKQYRKDLHESWMGESDLLERHKKARMFMGRLGEFYVADFLLAQEWAIENLEAIGGPFDLIGSRQNQRVAVEVKCIGTQDEAFLAGVHSLAGGKAQLSETYAADPGGAVWIGAPYAASNYLLYRAAEAAQQLLPRGDSQNHRRAIALVCEDWHSLKTPFRWIDWKNPRFLRGNGQTWRSFLESQSTKKKRQVELVLPKIPAIDYVLVFSKNAYRLQLEASPIGDASKILKSS